MSVTAGSLSATFYSTSWHMNSQQTLFHKQTGIFIGTLASGLVHSTSVRLGTLLQPSPVTLVLAEFLSGEGFGNGYKVNNTVMISNINLGAAGPSLLLTVTSVTASGAIRAVAVKSPTYRNSGAYFVCRVTFSGIYKLTIANNRNDFVAPFSVFVYPSSPCASTSMMTFHDLKSRLVAEDKTSFSVHLRDTFGNLVHGFSNPIGACARSTPSIMFFCIYLVDFMLSCDSFFCRPLLCCISTICFDRCIFHRSSGAHHTSIVLLHAREYPIVDAFRSKTRFFCDQCDRCNILHFIRSS